MIKGDTFNIGIGKRRHFASVPQLESHETPVIEGEEHVRSYASSEWAERSFCDVCGTHLFYRLSQNGQYIMPAGLFDNADDLVFDHQVCIDSKPGYYNFAEATHNMTCDEMFAAFAPPQ